jgi:hypothetical protein
MTQAPDAERDQHLDPPRVLEGEGGPERGTDIYNGRVAGMVGA